MLLSLESRFLVGAFVFPCTGATRASRLWSGTHRPAGVEEHEQTGMGAPQELGRTCQLHGRIPGGRYRVTNSRLGQGALPRCREIESGSAPVVPPSEGNEARREGRQES
jgi:hypothetical protein